LLQPVNSILPRQSSELQCHTEPTILISPRSYGSNDHKVSHTIHTQTPTNIKSFAGHSQRRLSYANHVEEHRDNPSGDEDGKRETLNRTFSVQNMAQEDRVSEERISTPWDASSVKGESNQKPPSVLQSRGNTPLTISALQTDITVEEKIPLCSKEEKATNTELPTGRLENVVLHKVISDKPAEDDKTEKVSIYGGKFIRVQNLPKLTIPSELTKHTGPSINIASAYVPSRRQNNMALVEVVHHGAQKSEEPIERPLSVEKTHRKVRPPKKEPEPEADNSKKDLKEIGETGSS
jgi:hypothetical protein